MTLRTQYRMAGDIQAVANALVYAGRLRCGCPAVEAATLDVRPASTQQPPWLAQVRQPHHHTIISGAPCNALRVSRTAENI